MSEVFHELRDRMNNEQKCLNCQYFIDYIGIEGEGFCEIHRDDVKANFMCNHFMDAQTQIEIHRSDLDEILKK